MYSLIIVNGRMGSGKTILAKVLESFLTGYKMLGVSSLVQEITGGQCREELQESYKLTLVDPDWLISALARRIGSHPAIVVGFRELDAQNKLRERYPDSILIHVEAVRNVRMSRTMIRDGVSEEDFIRYEKNDQRLGIEEVMGEEPDYVIDSTPPLDEAKENTRIVAVKILARSGKSKLDAYRGR